MASPAPDLPLRYPLTFSVSGANPKVDLSLRVAGDGTFTVDILTERSLAQRPPARLGAFRGELPIPVVERLAAVVAASRAAAGAGPPPMLPPGTVVRLVGAAGEPSVLAIGDEAELGALDEEIAAAAAAALVDPVAAVTAEAHPAGAGACAGAAELVITSVGREPFRLLLYASDTPGFWARTWIDGPDGPDYLLYEDVLDLVREGAVPEGAVDLAPGAVERLPLPPAARPGSAGGFLAWRAGEGPERRIVEGSWMLPAGSA